MNRFKYYYVGVCLIVLTACNVSDDSSIKADGDRQPLMLNALQNDALQTRAADGLYTASTGFDGGEVVKVFLGSQSADYNVGAPDATNSYKSALTPVSNRVFYPSGTTGDALVYAVYPAASATSHTVAYDQTMEAGYKASDLMYAKQTVSLSNKNSQQTLTFYHQLVKMKFILTKASNLPAITKVEMKNVKRKATVTASATALTLSDLASADGDDAAQGDNILVFGSITDTDAHTSCVVFPAQEWAGTDFLEVTIGDQTAAYPLTKSNWTSGAQYTMTFTIDSSGLTLVSTQITNWNDASGNTSTGQLEI